MSDRLEDRTLLTTLTVTSTDDTVDAGDGQTTLREAIIEANATAGLDTIQFDIAGGGAQTIELNSGLNNITDQVVIDGTTQGGFAGTNLITIDASAVTGIALSVRNGADGSIVRNLNITNTEFVAVFSSGSHGDTFEELDLSWSGTTGTGRGLSLS